MENMSHCRFQNTLKSLEDCRNHIQDNLTMAERGAREELVKCCMGLLEDLGIGMGDGVEDYE